MSSIGTLEEELAIEGYLDGYFDSALEHGGILGETVLNVEGRYPYRLDMQAIADIEAGLPPA